MSTTDLSGVWVFAGQSALPDDELALQKSHLVGDPEPRKRQEHGGKRAAAHGTFTRIRYYRVCAGPGKHQLLVLDEDGALAVFARDEANHQRWYYQDAAVEFKLDKDDKLCKDGRTLSLRPNLNLVRLKTPRLGMTGLWEPKVAGAEGGGRRQMLEFQADLQSFYWRYETSREAGASDTKDESGEADGASEGLQFARFAQQMRRTGKDNDRFGALFRNSAHLTLVGYPFCGCDPRQLRWPFATMGSPTVSTYVSNPGQTFSGGTLIFAFPTMDSMDYVSGPDIGGTPFLPLGLEVCDLGVQVSGSRTEVASSTADRMRSWSSSMGLAAGVEGMFNLGLNTSVQEMVEAQQKNESRYTISRDVTLLWALRLSMPQLQFHQVYLEELRNRLRELLRGETPRWRNFVDRFGTHYASVVTLGRVELAETRFSLAAESAAHDKSTQIALEASGVLDGALELTGKAEYGNALKQKFGVEFASEDVVRTSVGKESAKAIFLDLRPVFELLNPVLFEYNAEDLWQKYSPFVWHDLRASLKGFLENEMHLGRALSASLQRDLTPVFLSLTFTSIKVAEDDRRWGANKDEKHPLYAYGSIEVVDDSPEPNRQFLLSGLALSLSGARVDGEGHSPQPTEFCCVVAVRPGSPVRLKLKTDLGIRLTDAQWNKAVTCQFTGSDPVLELASDKIVDADGKRLVGEQGGPTVTVSMTAPQAYGLDIGYTLTMTARWSQHVVHAVNAASPADAS